MNVVGLGVIFSANENTTPFSHGIVYMCVCGLYKSCVTNESTAQFWSTAEFSHDEPEVTHYQRSENIAYSRINFDRPVDNV